MTFNIDLYDLRRREVQALGAALSCRDWYMMEKAYNSLRDKLDNAGFTVSGPPATPKPPAGGDAIPAGEVRKVAFYYELGHDIRPGESLPDRDRRIYEQGRHDALNDEPEPFI